jgi:hypothetical protein
MSVNPIYQILVPAGMLSIGTYLQNKDKDKVGADDAVGAILVSIAPAVTLALDGSSGGSGLRRAMTATRDAAQSWLDANPA